LVLDSLNIFTDFSLSLTKHILSIKKIFIECKMIQNPRDIYPKKNWYVLAVIEDSMVEDK
jgi:hypothetical protein